MLKAWTIPNVELCEADIATASEKVSFFSGDWQSLASLWRSRGTTFDIILTAETTYRPELYAKLHGVLEACCAPSGVVYLVSKVKYYGIGGDVCDFTAFLDKEGVFSHSVTQLTKSGIAYVCLEIKRR